MADVDTNTYVLLAIAALQALAAFWTWRTKSIVTSAAENIQKVETATNSMKDALVLATGKAEHAAGIEIGRAEGGAKLVAQPSGSAPVSVSDARTAAATEKTAAASEKIAAAAEKSATASAKSADAAERSADVMEKK